MSRICSAVSPFVPGNTEGFALPSESSRWTWKFSINFINDYPCHSIEIKLTFSILRNVTSPIMAFFGRSDRDSCNVSVAVELTSIHATVNNQQESLSWLCWALNEWKMKRQFSNIRIKGIWRLPWSYTRVLCSVAKVLLTRLLLKYLEDTEEKSEITYFKQKKVSHTRFEWRQNGQRQNLALWSTLQYGFIMALQLFPVQRIGLSVICDSVNNLH